MSFGIYDLKMPGPNIDSIYDKVYTMQSSRHKIYACMQSTRHRGDIVREYTPCMELRLR